MRCPAGTSCALCDVALYSNVRRLDAYKEFLQNPVQWVGRENHTLVNV
jgi:hypothetical protein